MDVLFLALGNARRRAVIDEVTQVLCDGGTATILIGSQGQWKRDNFPDGAQVIDILRLERGHPILRVEYAMLFILPRFIVAAIGRGPLRRLATRARKSYEHRIAKRVHRRVLKLHRRLWPQWRPQLVISRALRSSFDYVAITDYLSMEYGAQIMDELDASGRAAGICFGIDFV